MGAQQTRSPGMLHVVEQDYTFTEREKAEAQQLVLMALETYDEEEPDTSG